MFELARHRASALAAMPRALFAAILTEYGIREMPLEELTGKLGIRLNTEPAKELPQSEELRQRHRAALSAAHWSLRLLRRPPTCLRKALVTGHLLRSQRTVLRIGAAKPKETGFLAHAWLEVDGLRFPRDGAERYQVLTAWRDG